MVYAIFLPAFFYLPVALMLLGLIFRGAARTCGRSGTWASSSVR
jgi:hypothetical protein